jgi:hypothetical protein
MTKWKKAQILSRAAAHAVAREGKDIVKTAGKELFSIATLGLYRPARRNWGTRKPGRLY